MDIFQFYCYYTKDLLDFFEGGWTSLSILLLLHPNTGSGSGNIDWNTFNSIVITPYVSRPEEIVSMAFNSIVITHGATQERTRTTETTDFQFYCYYTDIDFYVDEFRSVLNLSILLLLHNTLRDYYTRIHNRILSILLLLHKLRAKLPNAYEDSFNSIVITHHPSSVCYCQV